jgi:hypothetical protein
MPTKKSVEWTASNGQKFRFDLKLEKHCEASSVQTAHGTVCCTSATSTTSTTNDEKGGTKKRTSDGAAKKTTAEDEVGYLYGYIIKRPHRNFHEDGDIASQELNEFTVKLFNENGSKCRVTGPTMRGCDKGAMFLIEKVEIRRGAFQGIDLGIHLVHEFLVFAKDKNNIGLCVMNPWTLSRHALRFKDNKELVIEATKGMNSSQESDYHREMTIKLRRQFTRMGFQPAKDTPEYVDFWVLLKSKYFSTTSDDDPKSKWLSKEEAMQLDNIPIAPKKHVESRHDTEFKQILEGLFSAPSFGGGMPGVLQLLMGPAGSMPTLLTPQVRQEMKGLVESGANLQAINALHMAAANYKSPDLFEFLLDDDGGCGMSLTQLDHLGQQPLHVAAGCSNLAAVQVLLARGADKKAKNQDGETAKQMVEKVERSMADFQRVMGVSMMGRSGGVGTGGNESSQIKRLLS